MFGFPFFTSLIVVFTGVVVVSLLANKGSAKLSTNKGASINTPIEAHAKQ